MRALVRAAVAATFLVCGLALVPATSIAGKGDIQQLAPEASLRPSSDSVTPNGELVLGHVSSSVPGDVLGQISF